MHIYKELTSEHLLDKIPARDAVHYYGISNIIAEIGEDELLAYLYIHCTEAFENFVQSKEESSLL